ncbi:hypothetical protein GH714_035972 [Hevea brasiliensis]|uniref:Uncharacterized protein n=1 Tax=Hevea brasiliensis TaxID=3981 RepID=A0A6A6KWQ3_HEVBR|nr:hypothetical protein GH714_035972 [Hevea brasiliensis]
MAFFRSYSNQTVSHSVLEEKGQEQRIGRMGGNDDIDVISSEREFDINMDAQYESEGENAGRMQGDAAPDNGVGVSNSHVLQSSGRRNAAGKWGSTFWKDCQPLGAQVASDSGHDSKSDYKNVEGSEDNISDGRDDRLESEDEDGQKEVGKGPKGHSDVPADEMLSDEYYEQDGEDQKDDPDDADFDPDYGVASSHVGNKVNIIALLRVYFCSIYLYIFLLPLSPRQLIDKPCPVSGSVGYVLMPYFIVLHD